jgi:hypothetical protein
MINVRSFLGGKKNLQGDAFVGREWISVSDMDMFGD